MDEIWKFDSSRNMRVTNTDVEPPVTWTNNYDEIGGDELWSSDFGQVAAIAREHGLQGTVKPIIGMEESYGKEFSLFEVDGNYYLYGNNDEQLYVIKSPGSLQDIVSAFADGGIGDIMFEPFQG